MERFLWILRRLADTDRKLVLECLSEEERRMMERFNDSDHPCPFPLDGMTKALYAAVVVENSTLFNSATYHGIPAGILRQVLQKLQERRGILQSPENKQWSKAARKFLFAALLDMFPSTD